jgi:hypothetical protein
MKRPTTLTVPSKHLKGLADDRGGAGGKRRGAGKPRRSGWGRRAWRHSASRLCRGLSQAAKLQIAGVDASLLKEGFDIAELGFDGVAQRSCLPCNRGAAEDNGAGQCRCKRKARHREAQQLRQLDEAVKQLRHGVEGGAQQHARKNQEQCRGEDPDEGQQRCKQHGAGAADRDCPGQVVARRQALLARRHRIVPNVRCAKALFRQNAFAIKW